MTLGVNDFTPFWQDLHVPDWKPEDGPRPEPFPWQQDLLRTVIESGRWPGTLDVPTGMGKTTALDIAVFALALAIQESAEGSSWHPRRIFMVIDRRVVVDQSYEHARKLAAALGRAESGIVAEVADALRPRPLDRHDGRDPNHAPDPLVAGRMRGGTTWAWRWLERPDQPAIIVGTVDQLGSRILFGGYGVGDTIRPIDAALTGSDSLVLIDEAHLAESFLTTVREARRLGAGTESIPGISRHGVVVMSATSGQAPKPVFRMDTAAQLGHDTARVRLEAPRRLHTVAARVTKKNRVANTGAVLANLARHLSSHHDVVGVVANTIAVARAAFDDLLADPDIDSDRVLLVTGRQRQVERDLLWEQWRDRIEAGRAPQEHRTFVVATQTIEVGADLDFSGLVTESASIDALVQRLGRLNRRGRWADATAVVVHSSTATEDDPIYGIARVATWAWLTERVSAVDVTPRTGSLELGEGLDASPLAMRRLLGELGDEDLDGLRMPRSVTPLLFPWVLERWVQTNPRPLDQPDLAPFLHGLERSLPSVQVMWRQVPDDWRRAPQDTTFNQTIRHLRASVAILPSSSGEIIDVPVWSLDAWLDDRRQDAADVADISTVAAPSAEDRGPGTTPPILVDGDEPHALAGSLHPGQTLVLPTWLGGLDRYGWNPSSTSPVVDVADLVEHGLATGRRRRSRRAAVRIDGTTLCPLIDDESVGQWVDDWVRSILAGLEAGEDIRVATLEFVGELGTKLTTATWHGGRLRTLLEVLATGHPNVESVDAVDDDDVTSGDVATAGPRILVHGPGAIERWSRDDTTAGTSASGHPVTLDDHLRAVGARAGTFASALGLPDHVRDAVTTAARLHDLGKLDPRFQRMLSGGVTPPMRPLAKSGMDPSQPWLFRQARRTAGYPSRMRHEIFSARAVHEALADDPERELITHLVAAHHGRARPLEQAVVDAEPRAYQVAIDGQVVDIDTAAGPDWDQPARFAALNERFGVWGLALLETIVRLADIGCSAEGS